MKLFVASTFAAVSEASHFRAVNFGITQSGTSNEVTITRSMTWRRSNSGYYGGCTDYHVQAQIPAKEISETCFTSSGSWCGSTIGGYIVTDIEDTLTDANNYCYGYRDESFTKPNNGQDGFSFAWDDCCWVKFTTDDNNEVSGGGFGFTAVINDPNNNTPQVKLPPLWKIMAGCPAQTLDLNPVDLDGDKIKCRFAEMNEALGAYQGNHNFGSITLDEDTCILTYDGTNDSAPDGVKPIALQIEDFNANGDVLSSMPIQFLATVWTPTNSNFRTGSNPLKFTDLFSSDDDDSGRKRRETRERRSTPPAYCNNVPVLDGATPAAGDVIPVPKGGSATIELSATSANGNISRFTFQSPAGMTCGGVNSNGKVTCVFTPTADQDNTVQNFCFSAEDNLGLQTERRCITLNVGASLPTDPPALVDIHDMLDMMDPNGPRYADYGCAGDGNMDAYVKANGRPVDPADAALRLRKSCIRCATDQYSTDYQKYSFDANQQGCKDQIGTAQRAFCSCDEEFTMSHLREKFHNPQSQPANSCEPFWNAPANRECCERTNGSFQKYNLARQECCADGEVRGLGQC